MLASVRARFVGIRFHPEVTAQVERSALEFPEFFVHECQVIHQIFAAGSEPTRGFEFRNGIAISARDCTLERNVEMSACLFQVLSGRRSDPVRSRGRSARERPRVGSQVGAGAATGGSSALAARPVNPPQAKLSIAGGEHGTSM
jgi:hypothetical protein